MHIRRAEFQDTAALTRLWKNVFNDDDSFIIKFFNERFSPHNAAVAEADGEIVSAVHWIQCELLTHEGVYPASYIVGAATSQEFRKQGIMSGMLEFCKDLCRESFLVLFPAVRDFYEKQGFKTASFVRRYALNRNYTEPAEAAEPTTDELNEAYNIMLLQVGGGISRDSTAWSFILDEKSVVFVKSAEGVAYALMKDGIAFETAASSLESAEMLLNRLSSENVKYVQAAPNTYIDSLLFGEEHETIKMGMLYPELDHNVYISEQY